MDKTLKIVWEFEKDSKKFTFCVPYGAVNYAEVYFALNEIAADIQETEKVALAQQKEQQEKEQSQQPTDVASPAVEVLAEPISDVVA